MLLVPSFLEGRLLKAHGFLAMAFIVIGVSCDSGTTEPQQNCQAVSLPLSGSAAAPVVVAVSLEVQTSGIVVLATATDPQGTENLLGVNQSISVFANAQCNGTPLVVQDDLAGSGVEESFGTVVGSSENPSLYNAIAAAASWPVAVDFRDQNGNRTMGRVMATVID